MPSTDRFTAANVSTPGSAPATTLSQYVKWPLVMLRLSICNGCRIAASASCTMSGLFTNASTGLSQLTNASKVGREMWTDLARYDFPWSSSPYARPNTLHSGTTT